MDNKCLHANENQKGSDPSLEMENSLKSFEHSVDLGNTNSTKEQHGLSSSSLSNTDMNEPCKQPPSSGSESEADKEDDVKVCDICGDAGQEDLLAICSRCIDGAEHTYCMRTMLTKLPGSDWLCEGCKFNEELENQKFKSEMETMISVQACSNADSLDTRSSTQSKITSEKNGTVRNSEDNIDCTMIQSSQMSVTKQLGNVDPDVGACKLTSEGSCASTDTSSTQMVSLLSSDDSIVNLDSAIRKLSSHPGGSYSILQGQKAQKSSGSLLRSTSFNRTDAKPKVKQILGAVPLAENVTGKVASKELRKGGLTREMVRSASFKTEKWSSSSVDSLKQKQSANAIQIKGACMEKGTERNVVERETSPLVGSHQVVDMKISRESAHGDNLGHIKYNSGRLSTSSTSKCSNGLNLQDQRWCQVLEGFQPHTPANKSNMPGSVSQYDNHLKLEFAHQDGIMKGAANFTNLNKLTAGGGQVLHGNETGHTNLGVLKHNKPTNQSKGLAMLSPANSIVAEELHPATSLCVGRQYFMEGRTNKCDTALKTHDAQQAENQHGGVAGRLSPRGNISEDCNSLSSKHVLHSMDLFVGSTLGNSVIPALEFFWQGGFEVFKPKKLPECFDGLQAHLSNFASGKVFEMIKKFPPCKVQLEEVPFLSSWPHHFHGMPAKENNIALFFFARDSESYRSNYSKLLENMLKYDLALKGNIDGVELLIFPSNKLPANSQRWNRLLFLWGLFKGRRSSSVEVQSTDKENNCEPLIEVKTLVKDLITPLSEASNYQEMDSSKNPDESDNYVTHMEIKSASSTGMEVPENQCSLPVASSANIAIQTPFPGLNASQCCSSKDLDCSEEPVSVATVDAKNVLSVVSGNKIVPAFSSFSDQRQDADTWRYVDVELEKINKEDDVLSDKSSSFSPERETQRKRSYSTFKGSFSNVSLPLLRNSGRSSSFACVDGMMQKIAKHGQEDISFFGEENSGVLRPPSVDGIVNSLFPNIVKSKLCAQNLELLPSGKESSLENTFPSTSMVSYGKNDKIPEDGEELPASLSLSLGFPALEERTVKSISKSEHLVSARPSDSTSFDLFGFTLGHESV
ncbi:hypothetical protein HPP92_012818 [Vanilla planifolia]|uniref:AIPP2-like SPOC-like domain-containing protein n=1 Tax=Vanilla planifolia TaxID=51239 RepID=A0A835QY73_VANPL|nr:hypothetical protein HPP92_012818 [Vanilla planifolia]